jgi:hypothetical protein
MNDKSASQITNIALKGIAVAMGVAVVVLNLLHAASIETQALLLGIGLFGLAVTNLQKER